MTDQIFYVGAQDDDGVLTGYVPAKFLMRNGAYVMNPMPGASQKAYLYPDPSETYKTDGHIANPYNYLIVPVIYTEQKAKDFAAQVADTIGRTFPGSEMGAVHPAAGQMIGAFQGGGPQDLQRHPQWGVPRGSFVPAFVGGASNHLGHVTAMAGLPMLWAEVGGGVRNAANAAWQYLKKSKPIDTEGPYWLSRENHANILQGYADGLAASKPPSPFADYGFGPRPQPADGQIGDGGGIAGWRASLAGIDPEESPPPAWPPQASRPIRYLGRRTQ